MSPLDDAYLHFEFRQGHNVVRVTSMKDSTFPMMALLWVGSDGVGRCVTMTEKDVDNLAHALMAAKHQMRRTAAEPRAGQ